MHPLGLCAVIAALLAGTAGSAAAAPDLAGHWRLDEGTGTTAADVSGNANHGAVGPGALWATGRFGTGLAFDGAATSTVTVPSSTTLEPAAVTAMAWVRALGSPGGYRYVIAKGATGCIASAFGIYTGESGGLRFYVSGDGGGGVTLSADAGRDVWDGAWHHVAGTFDGAAVRLYVDGVQAGPGTPRTAPVGYGSADSRALSVGHYEGCGIPVGFRGSIDEPKVFGRALNAGQIRAAMLRYAFGGFFAPVENAPVVNVARAGDAIPVRFTLGGFAGFDIFAAGSPGSSAFPCSTTAETDAIEQTVPAGSSPLAYDPASDRYRYVWRTSERWAGTCRRLVLRFDDGSIRVARFRFS